MYSPGDGACYWEEFYQLGIMGMGSDYLGDLNNFKSKDQLTDLILSKYPSTGYPKNTVLANWEFGNSVSIGDIILVKRGRNQFLGWGIVESEYFYDSDRTYYQKCRKVKWMSKGNWTASTNSVTKALTNITKYTEYVNELIVLLNIGSEYLKKIPTESIGVKKSGRSNLKIILNGKEISSGLAADNFFEFIDEIVKIVGVEKFSTDFSKIMKSDPIEYPTWKTMRSRQIENFYLDTHSSTQSKYEYVQDIIKKYQLNATVEIISNNAVDSVQESLIGETTITEVEVPKDEIEKIFLYSVTDRSLNWKKLNVYMDITNSQLIYELDDCEEFTYMIHDRTNDAIKIGKTTKDPELRLAQLRTGNPSITLLHTFPSSLFSEKELHDKFDDFVKNLEWFFYTKVLQKFISDNQVTHSKILESYKKRLELDKLEREILNHLT